MLFRATTLTAALATFAAAVPTNSGGNGGNSGGDNGGNSGNGGGDAPPAGVTDEVILQYALTLEHLESAFYAEALGKFNDSDFLTGGEQRALFEQIGSHEAAHVTLLETVLGDKATKACTYSFPYTDVQGFKALAQVLEGVGVTAYLGAAQYIQNPTYLTAAGSILTVEARHAAWLATQNKADPFPGPNDTPLGFSQVYSLAAPFITSCPDSNPKLPVKAFPALTLAPAANVTAGQALTVTLPSDFDSSSAKYVAFLNGLTPQFVPFAANQSVTVPDGLGATGTVYVVLTSSNGTVTDDTTVAGPAVVMFDPGYPAGTVVGSSMNGGSSNGDNNSNGGSSSNSNAGTGSTDGTGAASTLVQSWAAVGAASVFAALALL